MPQTIEGAGVELAYHEDGSGTTVVLVHGIGDTGAGWAAVARAPIDRARVVTYDRRGYGGSGAPEPYAATTVAEQTEDVAALITALGGAPVTVCGSDFGALVCLDLAQRHAGLAAGAVLVDPPVFAFVDEATEVLSGQRNALEERLRDAGPAAAVEAHLRAAGYDAARCERGRSFPAAFFADYAGLATLELGRRDLRALTVPVRILRTTRAAAHERAAAAALAELVPDAVLVSDGDDVAGAILAMLDSISGQAGAGDGASASIV